MVSLFFKVFASTLSAPFKFLWNGYCVCCQKFGFFLGNCLYIPCMMILFAGVISIVQNSVDNSPYKNLTLFHKIGDRQIQQELVDMVEMAAYAYVDSSSAHSRRASLESKGYRVFEQPYVNDMGLTYVTLTKGNTIYIAFRGSTKAGDFLDDVQMFTSGKDMEHMGRFIVAASEVARIARENPGKTITLVGHSLGGSTVQYVMKHDKNPNLRGFTVNPFGIPGNDVSYDEDLTDIIHEADVAQLAMLSSRHVGNKRYMVRGVFKQNLRGEWVPAFDITSVVDQHSVDNTLANMENQLHGYYSPPNVKVQKFSGHIDDQEPWDFSNLLGDTL